MFPRAGAGAGADRDGVVFPRVEGGGGVVFVWAEGGAGGVPAGRWRGRGGGFESCVH